MLDHHYNIQRTVCIGNPQCKQLTIYFNNQENTIRILTHFICNSAIIIVWHYIQNQVSVMSIYNTYNVLTYYSNSKKYNNNKIEHKIHDYIYI